MSEAWNRTYKSDNRFFGEEPSNFAILCFNDMKINNVKKILEIGSGHGKDAVFFASKGLSVDALDYSITAIEILGEMAQEKKLKIKPRVYDVNKPFPFPDAHFDAVYSHMLLNMRFSLEEIHFILSEVNRVLRPNGLNFFSVRNHNDKFYGKGVEVEKGIYDIDGFEVRFFTKEEIINLMSDENFHVLWIKEESEEPVTLYLLATEKVERKSGPS